MIVGIAQLFLPFECFSGHLVKYSREQGVGKHTTTPSVIGLQPHRVGLGHWYTEHRPCPLFKPKVDEFDVDQQQGSLSQRLELFERSPVFITDHIVPAAAFDCSQVAFVSQLVNIRHQGRIVI